MSPGVRAPRTGVRALLVLALGGGMSAAVLGYVFRFVLPAWNTPHTVAEGVPHARSGRAPCEGRARRVFVMIVDGVGYDRASEVASLSTLRREGAFRSLAVDFPTFTAPSVAAMFLGQGPRESGVRLNGAAVGTTGLDDVLSCASGSGLGIEVHARTHAPFGELVRPPPSALITEGPQAFLDAGAARHAKPHPVWTGGPATEIVVAHVGEADDAGHEWGAASPEFAQAAEDSASLVTLASGWLDPTQDVLFVLSDHGHRPDRGHGGDEETVSHAFLLAWGRGVRRGVVLDERPVRDVASTLTSTLGVPTPSSNLGRPMFDLFETEPPSSLAEPFSQAARYTCALTDSPGCARIDSVAAALDAGQGRADAEALLDELQIAHARDVQEASDDDRARRLGVGAALSLVALGIVATVARPRARLGWLAVIASALPFAGSLAVRGYRPTLSTMPPAEVFLPHAGVGALLSAVVVAALAWRLAWGTREALALILGTAAPIILLAAYVGHDPRAVAPPIASPVLFLLGPLVVAASLSAVAIVLVAGVRERSVQRALRS